jgi:hypothetical protein
MLIVWPFDAEGFIIGEETYTAITAPDFLTKLDTSQVPREFRDFIDAHQPMSVRLRGCTT